jgi:hypothetical protein
VITFASSLFAFISLFVVLFSDAVSTPKVDVKLQDDYK